jgi:hypothetical protein
MANTDSHLYPLSIKHQVSSTNIIPFGSDHLFYVIVSEMNHVLSLVSPFKAVLECICVDGRIIHA